MLEDGRPFSPSTKMNRLKLTVSSAASYSQEVMLLGSGLLVPIPKRHVLSPSLMEHPSHAMP